MEMEGGRYALLRMPALRREASERGLDSTGKKRDLILRLIAADEGHNVTNSNALSSTSGRSTANAGRFAEAVVRALRAPQHAAAEGTAATDPPTVFVQPVMPVLHDVADIEVDIEDSPPYDGEVDAATPVDADPYGEVLTALSEDPYAVLSEDPYGGVAEDPSSNADADTRPESGDDAPVAGEVTCDAEEVEEEVHDVVGIKGEVSADGTQELKTDDPFATDKVVSTLAMRRDGTLLTASEISEVITIDNDSGTEECSTTTPQQLAASPLPAAATTPTAPTMAQLQLRRRLRLRQLLQDVSASTSGLPYRQLLERLHVAFACGKAGLTAGVQVPSAPEMPEAAEAAPSTPLNVGNVEAQKAVEVASDTSRDASVDAQKVAEATPVLPTVSGDGEAHKAAEATPDVSINTGTGELRKEVDATLAGAEHIDSIYRRPDMPLALLRAYSSQARWVGLCRGFVIFEEDAVQYPASMPTPMRTAPGSDHRFNIASLWLLVALRFRYEEEATPALLEKLEATRIPEAHAAEVLSYLLGQCDHCTLLPVEPDSIELQTLPVPLTWCRRFVAGSVSPVGLGCGAVLGVRDGIIQSMPVAPSEVAPSEVNMSQVADAEGDRANSDTDVAAAGASEATAVEDVLTKAAEAAAAAKRAVDADADLCRLEAEEALLTQLLEDCGQRLAGCVRDLAEAEAHCRRLRGDSNSDAAQDGGDGSNAAKRLKLCGWA